MKEIKRSFKSKMGGRTRRPEGGARSRTNGPRHRMMNRYQPPEAGSIDYKNIAVLQRYLNDRGKIVPRRITGLTSHDQRKITIAIKKARILALLPVGGAR
jgi:small subunit ribosomal protein S18